MSAESNRADIEEQTPLVYVGEDTDLALRSALIAARVHVNAVDSNHKTALIYAVYTKNDNLVRALIRAGADLNISDIDRKTALIHAVENNKEATAIALIEAGADVNERDKLMRTALIHAVLNENEVLVGALITAKADTNAVDINIRSALIYAVYHEKDSLVRTLINAGADLNISDGGRKTALTRAVENNKEAAAMALIEAGADLNKPDKWMRTALIHAVLNKNECLTTALIGAGANVNAIDVNRKSALIYADLEHLQNIALALIAAGTDVNLADEESKTPLIHAADNEINYFCFALVKADAERTGLNEAAVDNFQKFICSCFKLIEDEKITNDIWVSSVIDELSEEKDMLDGLIEVGSDSIGASIEVDSDVMRKEQILKAFTNVRVYSHEWESVLVNVIQNDKQAVQKLVDNGIDIILSEHDFRSAVIRTARLEYAILVRGITEATPGLSERKNKGYAWIEDCIAGITSSQREPALIPSLIKAGVDVNRTDTDGKSALIYALQNKKIFLANTLIQLGADVNIFDKTGKTALIYAVKNNEDKEIVQALINAGAELDYTDNKDKTALFYSVLNEDHCLTQVLIEAGAAVNITDASSKSALVYAVEDEKYWLAEKLIESGADINITDEKYKTTLMHSANNETVDLARTLIEAGVDVNKTDNEYKTALIHAVQNRNEGLITLLISKEADVNVTDKEYKTALIHAVQNNEAIELVLPLIKAGTDVDIIDEEENSALIYAVQNGNITSTTALIDAGADVDIADKENTTALMYAIQNENETLARKLIQAGADANFTDCREKTALIYAAQHNLESITEELIDVGACVNMTDDEGKTALFYAVHNEYLVYILIKHGADATWEDNDSRTPLFYAVDEFVVLALVEDGKCSVKSRDVYGRSPLCYVLTKSLASAEYLLNRGENIHGKDACGLSCLAFFIDYFLMRETHKHYLVDGLSFFVKEGVSFNTVFKTIINAIFGRILSSYLVFTSILDALTIAIQHNSKDLDSTNSVIQIIMGLVREKNPYDTDYTWESQVPKILPLLIDLGANPNSTDSDGNSALHYATCLPFMGVSQITVMKICIQLETFGVLFNIKNIHNETPLLFCLQREVSEITNKKHKSMLPGIDELLEVWRYLLEHGSSAEETTADGKTTFHLMLNLFHQGLHSLKHKSERNILDEALKLFHLFGSVKITRGVTVNKRGTNLNSPLHIWASLRLNSERQYDKTIWESTKLITDESGYDYVIKEKLDFKNLLQIIFNYLLKCGVQLNDRNAKEETPLHLCKTWSAVKLLLDAGANSMDLDSSGRPPLLAAAKKRKFDQRSTRFYPDASEEPKSFWINVVGTGLDLWTFDKNEESVLGILIASEAFVLAESLLEVAKDNNYIKSDTIALSLLNTICKDESNRANWKSLLVEKVLKSRKFPVGVKNRQDTPLHHCCRNIVSKLEESSVHWTIAKLLVSYGADCRLFNESGETCLDIADKHPALKCFLETPMDIKKVPLLIPWLSVSKRYSPILEKAAKGVGKECEHVEPFWYHKNPLASGSFGVVFAGINEKDGREVAIKRIEKLRMQRSEDKREIKSLTALADCEQVVRYLYFFEDKHFYYLVLELMEGNLEAYLDSTFSEQNKIELCKDVVKGLDFLHVHGILHRDLKPSNILYRCHPKLCLKIADFGLSCRIDGNDSTTVYRSIMGTRCWIAPEVLKSLTVHSKSSDIFACGLVLHYTFSAKRHPFVPVDCEHKSLLQIANDTERNVSDGNMIGWDDSLGPEVTHLVKQLLVSEESKRPTTAVALAHPLFWTEKHKIDFLISVANQPEIHCPRDKRSLPVTAVEDDLESSFSYDTIVKHGKWNDPSYGHMPAIYNEMMTGRKTVYDPYSVVELVRFIRNAMAHVSDDKRPTLMRKQLLEDFVFLEYFPSLLIEVYKAVTTHGWDQTREEIKYAIS